MANSDSPAANEPRSPRAPRNRLLRVLGALAWAYPVLLLVVIAALTLIGERHWFTAAMLYVPRLLFAAPLVLFVPVAYFARSRRLLWAQGFAALLVVVPLMGFVFPLPAAAENQPMFRVMSFNIDSATAGSATVMAAIDAQHPDIAVLVEAPQASRQIDALVAARYPYVHRDSQFLIGSKLPLVEASQLPRVTYLGRSRTSRAMRYRLDTPVGPVVLYVVHPISPRGVFGLRHFRGIIQRIRTNEIAVSNDEESDMLGNAGLRSQQIQAALAAARAEQLPVIVAGDTNLPGLSEALRRAFAGFQDGFVAASWGFGYTFPAKRPFLRLDRIFAGPALRFASFQVGCSGASDHLCVWADLSRR